MTEETKQSDDESKVLWMATVLTQLHAGTICPVSQAMEIADTVTKGYKNRFVAERPYAEKVRGAPRRRYQRPVQDTYTDD